MDFGNGRGDRGIPRSLLGDIQCLQDRHTAGDKSSKRPRESGNAILAGEIAKERCLEDKLVEEYRTLGGRDEILHARIESPTDKQKPEYVIFDAPAGTDHDLREEWERFASKHIGKDLLKFGNDENQKSGHNNHGDHHHDGGIHHCRLHLALHFLRLLLKFSKAVEDDFQHASKFAGLDHIHI